VTRHLALVGCTASGKSAVALALARTAGDVELVSLDSMQVYREMDIGTAKPTRDEQAIVRHHLVDIVDPADEWSVRETQLAAQAALADVEARGKRALFVGGTGLYVRAVVDALDVPPRDPNVRGALEARADGEGVERLRAELQRIDPIAAARMEPDNRRRIVRALEVYELTGRPFSSFGPGLDIYGQPAIDVELVGLDLPSVELARRIEARFANMRDAGLLAEVEGLARRVGGLSRTACQAIGYKEVLAYVDGEVTVLDDAFELAVARTRRFARRQRVWFRRDPRIQWIDASGTKSDQLADAVMARWTAAAEARP
jgi:tRNA dimethylallyltransferase